MAADDSEKGPLWRLPQVRLKEVGKVGPAFGLGAGCGVGFGLGLVGGVGIGPGVPGLKFGFGFGAGCGLGYGFGYGAGRGVAHDDIRRYSNVGNLFKGPGNLPTKYGVQAFAAVRWKPKEKRISPGDEIGGLVDELVLNSKKLIVATSREIEKWKR